MATHKLPNMTANVTERTEALWSRFITVSSALGLSKTKAMEQAAALWLEANTNAAGEPWRHNPFAIPAGTSAQEVAARTDPFNQPPAHPDGSPVRATSPFDR